MGNESKLIVAASISTEREREREREIERERERERERDTGVLPPLSRMKITSYL